MGRLGSNGRGTFLHWRNQKFRVFSNSKIFKKLLKKQWKIYSFEKICIQKSQWKPDFLSIFSPIFQDFCHIIHLWNIPKCFGLVWGGGSSAGIGGYFRFFWGLYIPLHVMKESERRMSHLISDRPSIREAQVDMQSIGTAWESEASLQFSHDNWHS